MVQTVLTDGGIESEPYSYFKQNESVYRYIEQRLDGTRESYLNSDPYTRIQLLFDSATYALLTANTPLDQADRAFQVYRRHYPDFDKESLATDMAENGIGFYNNKTSYIISNSNLIDDVFLPVDRALVDGRDEEAQAILMDAHGLGPAKSAFTLAMLGFTDHACLDTHVCQQLGINPRVYDKYDATEYKELMRKAFEQVPELDGEISPFLLQWLLFDLNRGNIETHDHWFEHVVNLT